MDWLSVSSYTRLTNFKICSQQRALSLRQLITLSLCVVVCELQMMIGNAEYQCSCVRYLSQDYTALIVGLSVALALLIVIIIIIIRVVLYRRRQNKLAKQKQVPEDKHETSKVQDQDDHQYSRHLPDD